MVVVVVVVVVAAASVHVVVMIVPVGNLPGVAGGVVADVAVDWLLKQRLFAL